MLGRQIAYPAIIDTDQVILTTLGIGLQAPIKKNNRNAGPLKSSGDPVVRPRGTHLLGVEGEIAAIIGRRARHLTPEQGAAHVGWFAPANDVGLYDMRWADRGSNLLSKGQDFKSSVAATLEEDAEDREQERKNSGTNSLF